MIDFCGSGNDDINNSIFNEGMQVELVYRYIIFVFNTSPIEGDELSFITMINAFFIISLEKILGAFSHALSLFVIDVVNVGV